MPPAKDDTDPPKVGFQVRLLVGARLDKFLTLVHWASMATVNLEVPITDAEQAFILAATEELGVTMTPSEIKAWLEFRAKRLLKEHVKSLLRRSREAAHWNSLTTLESEAATAWDEGVAPGVVPDPDPEVITP